MSDSEGKRARRFHALQVTAILLLLAVLVGTLVLESLRLSDGIRRETAVRMTLPRKKTAQGYVFRDEAVISSINNGPVRYAVRDGATVSVGDLLADVYQDDTNTGKRALGADLMAQIEARPFKRGIAPHGRRNGCLAGSVFGPGCETGRSGRACRADRRTAGFF